MMVREGRSHFGELLQQTRESLGLSRNELAQNVGLDTSYIYRVEMGMRRPSRKSTLKLAEALGIKSENLDSWLLAVGHAPTPLLTAVKAVVRSRLPNNDTEAAAVDSSELDSAILAKRLEELGFQEGNVERLLWAFDAASPLRREVFARAVRIAIRHSTHMLEAPVRTAVIPAAGGQQHIIASHMMQRLLLRVISEAVQCGISDVVLVLAPGAIESLYAPLSEALSIATLPYVTLHFCEQAKPGGLGNAILQAEELVKREPFAVLLPDDVIRERKEDAVSPTQLRLMMNAFRQLGEANLMAITSVPRSKISQYGIVEVSSEKVIPGIRSITRLVEKPDLTHPITQSQHSFGIVGRYLLQPDIFCSLREEQKQARGSLQLTDGLDRLRRQGHKVLAFEMKAGRQDIGEAIGQASALINESTESQTQKVV
jgi:UTP--glucose-1-phosphate uridylyltransferase